MAYVTTGDYRHTKLTVTVWLNNEQQEPRHFSLLDAFTVNGVATLAATADQIRRMPRDEYENRIYWFKLYVAEQTTGQAAGELNISNNATGNSATDGVLACADNR